MVRWRLYRGFDPDRTARRPNASVNQLLDARRARVDVKSKRAKLGL
jgi:hypothetical protein